MRLKTNMLRLAIVLAAVTASPASARWITSWAAANVAPAPPRPGATTGGSPSFNNRTIRQILRLSAGGRAVRVRLTNAFGAAPLQVGGVSIAIIDDNGVDIARSARVLSFAGARTATIAKGAPLLSDPVALDLPPLSRVAVSVYVPGDTGPCTCHALGLDENAVSPPGDFTAMPFTPESKINARAFLAAVEVDAPDKARTVAMIADSITDGVGSTSGKNRRWPDVLAERLAAKQGKAAWGVANQGISGNQVLGDGAGTSALARLDRDILSLAGVQALIIFEGVNDLGINLRRAPAAAPSAAATAPVAPVAPPPPKDPKVVADNIIAAYQQIIARAHAQGIKVFGATIAPYKGAGYWSEDGEAARQQINSFIRTSGAFDAVLDFDKVLSDPADPASMKTGYHMGDHLHGSDAGYRALAESIDLKLFSAK